MPARSMKGLLRRTGSRPCRANPTPVRREYDVRRQVRESMRKMKSILGCWLLLSLCFADSAGQKRVPYPRNADDIIAFVGTFSQRDFSVKDAIKSFGTIYSAKPDAFDIVLTPFPSAKGEIKELTLAILDDTREGRRKLDYIEINYPNPISISYGELREKYGGPGYLKLPVVNCAPRAVNCPPKFVGHSSLLCPTARVLQKARGLRSPLTWRWNGTRRFRNIRTRTSSQLKRFASNEFCETRKSGASRLTGKKTDDKFAQAGVETHNRSTVKKHLEVAR
jgi:hypothetical protein